MASKVWLDTNLVRLRKAVLCANCEVISEGLNGHCAGCGSQSLLSLNRVLGGTIESKLSLTAPRLRTRQAMTYAFGLYPQRLRVNRLKWQLRH